MSTAPDNAKNIRAFYLWDWGTSAFSSVILTFVFSTYITNAVAIGNLTSPTVAEKQAAMDSAAHSLSSAQSVAALIIALVAPVLGGLADTGGKRNALLRALTLASIIVTALMVSVAPDHSNVLWAAILMAIACVSTELAGVFYNSVLPQISTEANRGRISGTAWALGYWGSILCLLMVLFGFVMPGTGLLGITGDNAWNLRAVAIFVALWMLVFTLPIMRHLPPSPHDPHAPRWEPISGYRDIVKRLSRAYKDEPKMLHYLIASAIYRDGLGAVFSLAGVIAASAYGMETTQIIFFGIAANLIAGIGVFIGGRLDDAYGSKRVIVASLIGVVVCGIAVFVGNSALVFWIGGLSLCLFVGPINSSSRTLLTRLSNPISYAENFGLYATAGRAFGFLGTGAFATAVAFGGTRWGMLGIVAVIVLGLLAFLPLKFEHPTGEGSTANA